MSLAQRKADAINEIDAAYESHLSAGAAHGGLVLRATDRSLGRWTGLLAALAAGVLPPDFFPRSVQVVNGVLTLADAAGLAQVAGTLLLYVDAVEAGRDAALLAAEGATTIEQVEAAVSAYRTPIQG